MQRKSKKRNQIKIITFQNVEPIDKQKKKRERFYIILHALIEYDTIGQHWYMTDVISKPEQPESSYK